MQRVWQARRTCELFARYGRKAVANAAEGRQLELPFAAASLPFAAPDPVSVTFG
jgi:hypothetical protein